MNRERAVETMMNVVNITIILIIVALYVVTGTGLGGDAVAALSNGTVYRGTAEGRVALECAVSWDAAALETILDTLAEADVNATFFVSGQWAKDNAALLKKMTAAGHEIGTMGYFPAYDGDAAMVAADIETAAAVIETVTGAEPRLYYSGQRESEPSEQAAIETGMSHIACTTDLLSGRGDAVDIASRALEHVFDGSILLLQPTAAAAEALPAILSEIAARGYLVTTVGDVLH